MSTAPTLQREEALAIRDADLVTVLVARRAIGGWALKAALWIIWLHGEQPITCRAVAHRTGMSSSTAWRAIRGLLKEGVIVETARGPRLCATYRVSFERLDDLASPMHPGPKLSRTRCRAQPARRTP